MVMFLIYIIIFCLIGTLTLGLALLIKGTAGGDVSNGGGMGGLLNFMISLGCICAVIVAGYFVFVTGL